MHAPVDVSRLSDGLEGVVNNRRTGLDAAENHIDIVDSSSRYGAQVLADREPSPTPQPHRHATYQDTHHVYMLLDFVPGGDFFSHLRLARRFSPATVKHYVGCIILALDYVHSRGVVYRDLKPENLLLDIKGRIKLTDFGLAKKVTDR
jgi:serine/threonine protein kinase